VAGGALLAVDWALGMIPLSKVMAETDYPELRPQLAVVDLDFTSAREQHPARKWEYALALAAWKAWYLQRNKKPLQVYDIGGAGSPFQRMLKGVTVFDPDFGSLAVVDPEINVTLETLVQTGPRLADGVFCLSVLEHVENLDQFLYHLSCLVAPGGLLFLTADFCDDRSLGWPEDHYHFHWMRKRIFNPYTWSKVTAAFLARDFELLGTADFTGWQGPTVFDYSFISLALVRRS
jgi:hypothetical protein